MPLGEKMVPLSTMAYDYLLVEKERNNVYNPPKNEIAWVECACIETISLVERWIGLLGAQAL
jgi:hypothetical protein